jgi:hypothetical protein
MTNETQKTPVEWYSRRLFEIEIAHNQGVINSDVYLKSKTHALEQAKEMEKEQQEKLSASWAKSREQTRESAMRIGFAKGFISGIDHYEDYYSELDLTDALEDDFQRNYITDRFEETQGGEQ